MQTSPNLWTPRAAGPPNIALDWRPPIIGLSSDLISSVDSSLAIDVINRRAAVEAPPNPVNHLHFPVTSPITPVRRNLFSMNSVDSVSSDELQSISLRPTFDVTLRPSTIEQLNDPSLTPEEREVLFNNLEEFVERKPDYGRIQSPAPSVLIPAGSEDNPLTGNNYTYLGGARPRNSTSSPWPLHPSCAPWARQSHAAVGNVSDEPEVVAVAFQHAQQPTPVLNDITIRYVRMAMVTPNNCHSVTSSPVPRNNSPHSSVSPAPTHFSITPSPPPYPIASSPPLNNPFLMSDDDYVAAMTSSVRFPVFERESSPLTADHDAAISLLALSQVNEIDAVSIESNPPSPVNHFPDDRVHFPLSNEASLNPELLTSRSDLISPSAYQIYAVNEQACQTDSPVAMETAATPPFLGVVFVCDRSAQTTAPGRVARASSPIEWSDQPPRSIMCQIASQMTPEATHYGRPPYYSGPLWRPPQMQPNFYVYTPSGRRRGRAHIPFR